MSELKRQAAGKGAARAANRDKGAQRAQAPRRRNDDQGGGEARAVSVEERRRMVAEAAYFRAARRDFEPGGELADWVQAEAEVERRLTGDTSGIDRPDAEVNDVRT